MSKQLLYWIAQVGGWLALVTIGLFSDEEILTRDWLEALGFIFFGIFVTHIFRFGILKLNGLKLSPLRIIPVIILGASLMATLFYFALKGFSNVLDIWHPQNEGGPPLWIYLINYFIFFFFWCILYFGYHFFERSRDQEIKNIQLEATKNEAELQNLRTQLNPHFMFNSMNSIRALIDEDPKGAKIAVTKLSNLLRSTLVAGKKDLVSLQEEVDIVGDYLDLEKVRFEERLNYEFQIPNELKLQKFPPLLLQTVVENAVKHGISKKNNGGEIQIKAFQQEEQVHIEVWNTGKYAPSENANSTSIGIENSSKRLSILFGDDAHFEIKNSNGMVVTIILLPLLNT